jgi:DNA replication ATP-dependent helicase Dna2
LPTCIGPLRYAKTFVLVGDLYQLPPIVRNRDASEGGLDKSLFSILAEARPESICYLEYQYRMCREIMDVSNKLVYAGKLKCGNYQTSTRQLDIPNMASGLDALHQGENLLCKGLDDCWLKSILDPG